MWIYNEYGTPMLSEATYLPPVDLEPFGMNYIGDPPAPQEKVTMPQRTLTLDALMDRLEALCQEHGGETPAYIYDADSGYSLGIVDVWHGAQGDYTPIPLGVYLSGEYDTEEV